MKDLGLSSKYRIQNKSPETAVQKTIYSQTERIVHQTIQHIAGLSLSQLTDRLPIESDKLRSKSEPR